MFPEILQNRKDIMTLKGERIREYILYGMSEGKWQLLGAGSSIGHKRIEVINKVMSAVKLEVIKSDGTPLIKSLACFGNQGNDYSVV